MGILKKPLFWVFAGALVVAAIVAYRQYSKPKTVPAPAAQK